MLSFSKVFQCDMVPGDCLSVIGWDDEPYLVIMAQEEGFSASVSLGVESVERLIDVLQRFVGEKG